MIEFQISDPETGTDLGTVQAENLDATATFKLYGGCEGAKATFHVPFGDGPVMQPGNAVTIRRHFLPIFAGRVLTVEPAYGTSRQEVNIEGWWRRVQERQAVEPALLDHVTFGDIEGSDHPEITTAFGVVQWIVINRLLNDPASPITLGGPDLVQVPPVPAKLAGPFMLYAKDDLSKVLSMLATMEDCVVGIDSMARLYYLPRDVAASTVLMTTQVIGNPPADWRHSQHGVPTGNGRFVYDRRGPNSLSIFSRTKTGARAIRDYNLVTGLPPGTSRTAGYRAANIFNGVQARRLARGLFRRFSNFHMKVEQLEVRTGTMRFEPHLGRVRVVDALNVAMAEDLCGTVQVAFGKDTIQASITIGENAEDPGSDIPINDPWAPDPGWYDDPQVDTGDGIEDPEFPLPSGDIDLDDDFDGDGDDFHVNPDRDDPKEDPPAEDVPGVDYGTDVELPQDPTIPGGQTEIQPAKIYLAGVIGVNPGEDGNETYNVQLYKPDGSSLGQQRSNLETWPDAYFQLQVGQKVLVVEPEGQQAYVDASPASPLWPGRISDPTGQGQGPTVEVLAPTFPYDQVLGLFPDTPTWPTPDEAPTYTAGEKVALAWFNNQLNPVILRTGGGNATGCYNSYNIWGTIGD